MMKWLFESEVEDLKIVFRDAGPILITIGLFALLPAFVSLIYREVISGLMFFLTAALYLSLGYFFSRGITVEKKGSSKHAAISVALAWVIAIFLGAVPYLSIHGYVNALFESAAGFTTTGFTMIARVSDVERGVLFWRVLESFAGGILFVSTFLSLSKAFEVNSELGFKERMENLVPRVLRIYISLALVGVLLFLLTGVEAYNAVSYSLSSVSTGGFSVSGNLGALNNQRALIVNLILTLVGALNILLIFKILEGDMGEITKNIEVRMGALVILLGVLAAKVGPGDYVIKMYHFFSALTTSGFMITDTGRLAETGELYKAVLICVMLIGGSIYSTSGGLKIHRLGILLKSLYWRVSRLMPDKNIVSRKVHNIEDMTLTDELLLKVYTFAGFFLIVYVFSVLVVVSQGYPIADSFFEVASVQSNVGLTTGIVSPDMPLVLKALFTVNMVVGRLEVLAFFGLVFYFSEKLKAVTLGR